MKPSTCVVMVMVIAASGCGDDASQECNRDGGAACFDLPTEVMRTYEAGGASDTPVIGCGQAVPVPSTTTVALRGTVTDHDSNQPVAGVTLQVSLAKDYENAIATATTDANGAYSMNLASGTNDLLWGQLTGGGVVPQLHHELRPDLSGATVDIDYVTAPPDLLDMFADRVTVERNDALSDLTVHVRDCSGRLVMRTAVVISATASERDFVEGVPVFYSVGGTAFPLPTSHEQVSVTGPDGAAVAINVPIDGGELYVQAWGFPDAAALGRGEDGLVLIAEHAVTRRAGTTTWVNLRANQD